MANNKVQLANGTVLIDLTDTTAEASDVASGSYFYNAAGVKTEGTLTPTPTYSVTKNLTNVTTNNDDTAVLQGNSFFADLIPVNGCQITNIVVTMGGVDITSQVFTPGTGTKSITANGTYSAATDYVSGYSSVSVNVPNSYSASDEGKVVSNGALVSQTSATYTSNATYDTTLIDSVTVNVSGGSTPTGTKQISITSNGTTTEDVTDYAYAEITINVSGGTNYGTVTEGNTLNEMFYAIEHNLHSTGTVIVSSYFPANTESLFCDTGFNGNLRGMVIYDTGFPAAEGNSTKNLYEAIGFFGVAASSGADQSASTASSVTRYRSGQAGNFLAYNGTARVNSGKLYIKPTYATQNNVLFQKNHTYRWIAWPYHS